MGNINIVKATCIQCEKPFTYVKYKRDRLTCSTKCKSRHYYETKGTYNERSRRSRMSPEEWKEHKREYDREYRSDPTVRERIRQRQRLVYATEAYRAYARDRYHRLYGGNGGRTLTAYDIDRPYVGHDIFDAVREYVGEPHVTQDSMFADQWNDAMGEATLAYLEGRDVKEALDKHRKTEYPWRYRTTWLGDWKSEIDEWRENRIIPTQESAEDEALARMEAAKRVTERYRHGTNDRPYVGHRHSKGPHPSRTKPTRRRGFRDWQSNRKAARRAKYA